MHWEVESADTSGSDVWTRPIIVENVLGKWPEPFDAIDVVLGSAIHETRTVIDRAMLAITPQRLIALKGIRVIDRPFPSSGLNMGMRVSADTCSTTFVCTRPFRSHNSFTYSTTAPPLLASPTEIGFIQFNLTGELAGHASSSAT